MRISGLRFVLLAPFLFALGVPDAHADVPGRQRGEPVMNLAGAQRGVHYGTIAPKEGVTAQALFGGKLRPHGTEMKQGEAGDCYLDSTAAVYAEFHPEVLKRVFLTKNGAIRTNGAGEPAARFFVKDHGTGQFKPGTLAGYTGRVPVDKNGKPVLDKVVDGRIWGPEIEFSYAKFRDAQASGGNTTGFARTGNGGFANHVMQALTGKPARLIDIQPKDEEKVWQLLKEAQSKNEVVVAGTTTSSRLHQRIAAAVKEGALDGRSNGAKFDEKKWVEAHAYSVWGDKEHPFVFEKNGVRMIRLRNPWGTNAPGGEGKNGIGEVPFHEFMLRYDQISIGAGDATHEHEEHDASR